MPAIHDFKESVKVGESGELILLDYLKQLDDVVSVEDVRDNKIYRDKDIDFIVHMTQLSQTVEIKTDTYDSPNIFFETMSAKETNSIGCMYKTEADWLLYYFINSKELYVLDMCAYREWVDENAYRFRKTSLKNYRRNSKQTYTSEGILVPKSILTEEFHCFKTILE